MNNNLFGGLPTGPVYFVAGQGSGQSTFDFRNVRPIGMSFNCQTQALNPVGTCPPPTTVRKSAYLEGIEMPPTFKDKPDMVKPLKMLEELCEYPVLYVNHRFVDSKDGTDNAMAVTVSNNQPEVDEKTFKAVYPKDAIGVDIFFLGKTEGRIQTLFDLSYHWVNIVCSILTFRGHEVFLDGKLFTPYEK